MPTSISLDHKDKVVVITGVSGQLGNLLASQYMDLGAKVIGLDFTPPNTSDPESLPIDFFKLDIRNVRSVDETFKALISKFGGVDVLINNAGTATFEHFLDRTEENVDLMMDVRSKVQAHVSPFRYNVGGRTWIRTRDRRLMRPLL